MGRETEKEIYEKFIEIGSDVLYCYIVASLGYTNFFEKEQPNEVIEKALHAVAITEIKTKSVISYQECTKEVKNLEDSSAKSTELYDALKNEKLSLVFQPIVDIQESKIIFHESLLRMESKSTIQEFILAAEETGLILLINKFVAKKSLKIIQEDPNAKLSISFSTLSITIRAG